MRCRLLAFVLCAACAVVPRPSVRSLEEVFEPPFAPLPGGFAFAPDGKSLTFVLARKKGGLRDLWSLDLATGKRTRLLEADGPQKLSAAERGARERKREGGIGIGSYFWNPRGGALLLPLSGDLHLLRDGRLSRLAETKGAERNPRWSPDGDAVAYVRAGDLYVRRGATETRLTRRSSRRVEHGLAEFIAAEELGRHEGFWWAPDSSRIACVRTDSARVPWFVMHDHLAPAGRAIPQRYPRAGDANVQWQLDVIPAAGGEPVTMRLPGEYLVRVKWMPDGMLAAQVADRAQRLLELYRCDPATGTAEKLFEERDAHWVPFHDDLRFFSDGSFLWSSERTGRRHLYRVVDGEARPLTSGDWDVTRVLRADRERGVVFFEGAREGPRERHVYRVGLDGSGLRRLTRRAGWNRARLSPDLRHLLVTHSRAGVPPTIRLHDLATGRRRRIAGGDAPADLPRPEFVTVPADDGTPLAAMLYRSRRPGRRPAIVHTYGGPGAQLVADRWGGGNYFWHTRLAELGYTVLTVDNRGSGGYGRDFCRVVSGRLCHWEVVDQAAGARWLAAQEFVDGERIGVWGWSYGGTMTIMCLLHAAEHFAAGAAVAPVTDWRDYDTAYTERYLSTPAANPEGYAASSPITAAERLARPLFLAHGMLDDNVHFRGTVAFLDRAQRSGAIVETDFYPRGAHGIGGARERRLLYRRMEAFWARTLGD